MSKNNLSRRSFLKTSAAAAAAFSFLPPQTVLGKKHGYVSPSDKLNIAGIGIGGRGASNLSAMANENIVALCDVDWKYAANTFEKYPKAQRFWDYREMFDKMGNSFDAIMCATADHTHAIVCADAMTMGKHVYCEKPLTHSVYESRLLTRLAKSKGVVTQMGNQGASNQYTALACEYIWSGAIGDVTRVDCATDRPIWPQGLNTPDKPSKTPKTLNWDLFTGPAKMRDFNEVYHPWNWRGWWDYGTGALGDMACHIMQIPFVALNLGSPKSVEASSTLLLRDCAPTAQHVKFVFPARDNMPKMALPEVEVHWYDGGLLPERPANWPVGEPLMRKNGGLVIFHGTKDTLVCDCYGSGPFLLSGREIKPTNSLRRINTGVWDGGHQQDWIAQIKAGSNRVKTTSDFEFAGPLNEMVVMGVLAVRLQGLHKTLEWDGENMQFTNIGPNEELRICIKDGFSIKDGHPSFNKDWTDPINAQNFANELIKHNYREGWNLVEMPKI